MRSITTKLICTLVITALLAGGAYWLSVTPWTFGNDGTSSVPSGTATVPPAPTTLTPSTSSTTLPPHTHAFTPEWQFDENLHWHQCDCGEPADIAAHTDEDANNICDICQSSLPLPPHQHSFSNTWEFDDSNHWYSCECGQQANIGAHIDEDVNYKCDICNGDLPLPPHEHSFDEAWEFDEYEHWHSCSCGEKSDVASHTDTDHNDTCDVCYAVLPHVHIFCDEWLYDNNQHWHICDCGELSQLADHTDTNTDGQCDTCGATVAPPPHEHSFENVWKYNEDSHWNVCACGEKGNISAHIDNNKNDICDACGYILPSTKPPTLSAHSAFIYDYETQEYLFKNQELDKLLYPASITKLFTCYVALLYIEEDEFSDVITLGDEQKLIQPNSSMTGLYGLDQGDHVSIELLLHATLMESGADATYGLVAFVGRRILDDPNATARQAVDAFMERMNAIAEEFNMGDTHFVTPDGYHDPDHKVSLQAIVTIAEHAMENETIRTICGKQKVTMTYVGGQSGKVLPANLINTNALLHPEGLTIGSKHYNFYCEDAVGLKTGSTNAAGKCFLGLFIHDGKYIVIGIFGSATEETRWTDVLALWEYYLRVLA